MTLDNSLIPLCLSFLSHKMKIVVLSTSECWKEKLMFVKYYCSLYKHLSKIQNTFYEVAPFTNRKPGLLEVKYLAWGERKEPVFHHCSPKSKYFISQHIGNCLTIFKGEKGIWKWKAWKASFLPVNIAFTWVMKFLCFEWLFDRNLSVSKNDCLT